MIPHFNLLISRLLNIEQKSFCTPDEAMDPTFPMPQLSSMFVAREIKQNHVGNVLWDTLYNDKL